MWYNSIMDKQMKISASSDELAQVRTKEKEFLTQIERIVPWKEWLCLIQPCYYKGERGNKPYPLETMLRLYLLQNLYDLSDEATVAEVVDSPVRFRISAASIPVIRFRTEIPLVVFAICGSRTDCRRSCSLRWLPHLWNEASS